MSLEALAIAVHAGAGLVSLVTGLMAARSGQLFVVYLGALIVMVAGLAAAVAAGWPEFDMAAKVLFSAFIGLALVMVWLGLRAREAKPAPGERPSAAYLDRIGFTLVALADAFVVILVLDLGAPIWAVVASGVVIGVAGHFAIRSAKAQLTPVAA